MNFLKDLIPSILKVLDVLPLKGWRTTIFFALTALVEVLSHTGTISKDVSDPLVAGLLTLTGYYAAKH